MPGRSHKKKRYSKEIKERAAKDYLKGGGSYETLKTKYELLSSTQLKNWVKKINDQEMEIALLKKPRELRGGDHRAACIRRKST